MGIEGGSFTKYDRDEERSPSRILDQLQFMGEQVSKTHATFIELLHRLDPILIPEQDSTANGLTAGMPTRPTSELSTRLDDMNSQIISLQRRIAEALERVQL